MSEHRRKPPQSPSGGRAAARRGGQQPTGQQPTPPVGGRRAGGDPRPESRGTPPGGSPGGVPSGSATASPSGPAGGEPYQGRAAARRASQGRGHRRRAGAGGSGPGGPAGPGGPGGPGGPTTIGPQGSGPGRGRGRRPGKKRFIDYPRFGRTGWRRWMPSWRQVTAMCVGFFGTLIGIVGIAYAMVSVPNVNLAATSQNNVYYWADGSQMIATGAGLNRQIVSIDDIPKGMQNAVVSAENKTFWTDKGVDPMGITRALYNMARGGQTQGGSTITQQYVKNTRLTQQQTISRKFKELFISIKVGATMKKSDIMAGYLNTSYFGRGAYGIQAAARTYYGVDAIKLNPSQCAVLAAVLKGPTYFDPAGNADIDSAATPEANLKRSQERWGWILDREVKDGWMTATERAKYTKYPMPQPVKKNAQMAGQIGYMVDLAKRYVTNNHILTADQLAHGGYQIYTTFQKPKVDALEAAVKRVQKANIKPGGTHMHYNSDTGKKEDVDKFVQFGGASLDPKTGAIEAIYGGTDATKHFTNNADETGAQVGSTFKPFVLAAAMTDGVRDPNGPPVQGPETRTKVSPDSMFSGKNKQLITDYTGKPWIGHDQHGQPFQWRQTNDDGDNFPRVTLRVALDKSLNAPFVQLGQDVGTDKVHDEALAAGLVPDAFNGLDDYKNSVTYSIGTSSPSAIRMADAYATIDNHGRQNEPFSVTQVKHDGGVMWKHQLRTKSAFEADVADTITGMLQDVVKHGTGTPAQLPDGRPAAGKTGTTDDNKSAWFDGYTPQLVTTVVMYRRDDQQHTDKSGKAVQNPFLKMYGTGGAEKVHGDSFPAQIWRDYMSTVLKETPAEDFQKPSGDIGKVVYGNVSSPTPSPTATTPPPTTTPATTPPTTPVTTPPTTTPPPTTPTPTGTPTGPCPPWNLGCNQSPSPSTTPPTGGTTNGTSGGPPGKKG
ncbi:transglycosylase domain-containing protein [Streptomyces sp. HPF1205]|uniref:transglycosylase domain-containing protein n=1 Tax=Streptomyces sp. HPF1205 TaxID=2873262 RepID=UPI001CED48AF|nr:transglycosylase domain-containing protein [Streptomyces sp. HPF1205]